MTFPDLAYQMSKSVQVSNYYGAYRTYFEATSNTLMIPFQIKANQGGGYENVPYIYNTSPYTEKQLDNLMFPTYNNRYCVEWVSVIGAAEDSTGVSPEGAIISSVYKANNSKPIYWVEGTIITPNCITTCNSGCYGAVVIS